MEPITWSFLGTVYTFDFSLSVGDFAMMIIAALTVLITIAALNIQTRMVKISDTQDKIEKSRTMIQAKRLLHEIKICIEKDMPPPGVMGLEILDVIARVEQYFTTTTFSEMKKVFDYAGTYTRLRRLKEKQELTAEEEAEFAGAIMLFEESRVGIKFI